MDSNIEGFVIRETAADLIALKMLILTAAEFGNSAEQDKTHSVQTHWALIIIFVPHVCQTLAIASQRNVKKFLNLGTLRFAQKSSNARWQANTRVLSRYPQVVDNEAFG